MSHVSKILSQIGNYLTNGTIRIFRKKEEARTILIPFEKNRKILVTQGTYSRCRPVAFFAVAQKIQRMVYPHFHGYGRIDSHGLPNAFYKRICVYVRIYADMGAYVRTCAHSYAYVGICAHMYACVYMHSISQIHAYIHV